jgi:hypothetical protein
MLESFNHQISHRAPCRPLVAEFINFNQLAGGGFVIGSEPNIAWRGWAAALTSSSAGTNRSTVKTSFSVGNNFGVRALLTQSLSLYAAN